MARKFGFPYVAALGVGQSCNLPPEVGAARKIRDYAIRNNKRFRVEKISRPDDLAFIQVTRLPVTDTELPGA